MPHRGESWQEAAVGDWLFECCQRLSSGMSLTLTSLMASYCPVEFGCSVLEAMVRVLVATRFCLV